MKWIKGIVVIILLIEVFNYLSRIITKEFVSSMITGARWTFSTANILIIVILIGIVVKIFIKVSPRLFKNKE